MRIHENGNLFELSRCGCYVKVVVNGDETWMCEDDEVLSFIHTYGKE